MKAVRLHSHGGLEALVYEDVPDPQPGPGEVLVRLRAAGLNYRDIECRLGRRGLLPLNMPLPQILGADGAGVVEGVGTGVDGVRLGDPVLVAFVIGCGQCRACLNGREQYCPSLRTIGLDRPGTYAQRIALPAANAVPKPSHLSFEEASCLGLVLVTCWSMMVTRGRLQAGEQVLVHAAGGGMGSMALQIAKAFGARVIATAGSDAKLARALSLGADAVVSYRRPDWVDEVRRLSGGQGVDMVVDAVGGRVLVGSVRALRRGGRIVTGATGTLDGDSLDMSNSLLVERRAALFFSAVGSKGELRDALRLVEQGSIRPVVHQVLPLPEAARAQQLLEDRAQFGKVVLSIP